MPIVIRSSRVTWTSVLPSRAVTAAGMFGLGILFNERKRRRHGRRHTALHFEPMKPQLHRIHAIDAADRREVAAHEDNAIQDPRADSGNRGRESIAAVDDDQ